MSDLGELLMIAAQMARHTGMPNSDELDWPKSTPQYIRRKVRESEDRAREQCTEWAQELWRIFDFLYALRIMEDK